MIVFSRGRTWAMQQVGRVAESGDRTSDEVVGEPVGATDVHLFVTCRVTNLWSELNFKKMCNMLQLYEI